MDCETNQSAVSKTGQVAIVVDNMEEFSEENLPNFSVFSSSNRNKRFPWLQEEEINTLRSRNENSNTAKSTKTWVNVFNFLHFVPLYKSYILYSNPEHNVVPTFPLL